MVGCLGGVVESPPEGVEDAAWGGVGGVGEANVDESMLREVNFLSEPTPCSMKESFLLPISFPSAPPPPPPPAAAVWCVATLEGVVTPLCEDVGTGTLVGRYPNRAVGLASGIMLGSVMGDAFVLLYKM